MWVCRQPNGHIQAVGTDAAGRRQYLYHPQWRLQRDQAKHDRVLTVAARLPKARERVAEDLDARRHAAPSARWPPRSGCSTSGFFRIGGETYAEQNGSYGLATITRDQVSLDGDLVVFEYTAKSGQERYVALGDPRAAARP